MQEKKKIEHALVADRLRRTADKVYEYMYLDWKRGKQDDMHIKVPNKLTFNYDVQALLPQKYMSGVHGYHPNTLYNALLDEDLETAFEKIKRTQYLSIREFSLKYNVDAGTVKKEWDTMWTIATGTTTDRLIPSVVADAFYKWMSKSYISPERYAKLPLVRKGGKNYDTIFEIVEARNIVERCIFIESYSEDEWKCAIHELHNNENEKMIYALWKIWK